jgi:hypothetical protein
MTSAGGHRRADRPPLPWLRALLHLAGVVAAGAAWFLLVRAAIDFGQDARAGAQLGWLFLALASAGAVACLLLGLLLGTRALLILGVLNDYTPKRARRH